MSGYTNVTATIKDPSNTPYAHARVAADFVNQSSLAQFPLLAGISDFQRSIAGIQADSFGFITLVLADNNQITPTPSKWKIAVTSADGTVAFNTTLTITGATQDISSALQASAAPLAPVVGGTVFTSLVPSGDLTLSLGTSSKRWNASLGATTVQAINNRVFADQFAGGDLGARINAAITALALISPTGGIVDCTGFNGNQAQSTTVTIPAGVTVLLGAIVCQSTISPAFVLSGTGATLRGLQQGSPFGSTMDVPSVIQAATGLTGPIVKVAIGSGSRGALISDLQIDGNNIGTVTSGLFINDNTDEECGYERISIGNCPTGIALGTPGGTGNLQEQKFWRVTCFNCALAVDLTAPNLRDIEFWACQLVGKNNAFLAGADDANSAHTSSGIRFFGGNMATTTNTATAIGVVRNVQGFVMSGVHIESDPPSTYTTQIVLGTANGGGVYPLGPSITNCEFEGDGNVSYNIELRNGIYPYIAGNVFRGANTKCIKNTSITGGTIWGNDTSSGSGSIIDVTTGLVAVMGNTTLANDLPIFPQGIQPTTVVLTGNAPSTAASQLGLGVQTATTASAGGNGAVPAQVQGYLLWNLAGVTIKVPFFNN